ncbi:MAG: ketol-acid reductoisomerase [Candidatus Binatia bacterium]
MNVYRDGDADLRYLQGKTIAVLGYGSQGHAHAHNLRDSGAHVVVGLPRDGGSWAKAVAAGLDVRDTGEAARLGDIIMIMVPDELGGELYARDVAPAVHAGTYLAFAHGFNIHFKRIVPPANVNVFMVAPKGPGSVVRSEFQKGRGVPCLLAVHQDPTGDTAQVGLAYAKGIGGTRAAVMETTFKEETETDLFGEQAVLCGGLTELIRAGYDTLVEAGYTPEMAYFECVHEVKLIADLIYERGIANMHAAISNTAEYGDMTRGKRVIGPQVREAMKSVLAEIQSGNFAQEWITEYECGMPHFNELRKEGAHRPIEKVGAAIRSLIPWLGSR